MSENALRLEPDPDPQPGDEGLVVAISAARPSTTRYRAKIDSCHPATAREILAGHRSCFLGVSLENRGFSDGKFLGMIEWIGRRCDRCLILIGDSIHRKTIQIRSDLPEQDALDRAIEIGREYRARASALLQSFKFDCSFELESCAEVQCAANYTEYLDIMRRHFSENAAFKASVAAFSESYIEKKGQILPGAGRSATVQLSIEYFLEELAIFACLVERGYPVMVYPGTFSSLEAIVEGQIAGLAAIAPKALVSLQLKGR